MRMAQTMIDMTVKQISGALAVLIVMLAACAAHGDGALSPVAVLADPAGTMLYVAQTGASRVDVVSVDTGEVTASFALPQNPLGLALSADGGTLYVTGDDPAGALMIVDLPEGSVTATLAIGHTPMAPVVTPSGQTLFVCVRFDNSVAVVDLAQQAVVATIPVSREPVAAALTPDGALLYVANHLPTGPADAGVVAAEIQVIDTRERRVVGAILLPDGSSSLRGMCVSPDGGHVYVTHLLSRYTMPTTQLERGWMNTNALSVLDARSMTLVNTVLLDETGRGAANPWAVACTPDGQWIAVTHAGTDEVSVIDRAGLHEKLDQVASGALGVDVANVPNILSFLGLLRTRVPLGVKGPRGIAVAGSRIAVTGYFSDNIELLDLSPDGAPVSAALEALGPQHSMSDERRGEMLFNDAGLCFQQWQSCASCHPDTRADGLNWDLLNDGLGNPKNTKSLLLSHQTPPVMSLGVRADAETAVRAGIKFIQFAEVTEENAPYIDAYLRAMKPVESPRLEEGRLGEAALRGERVFKEADCATCHSGPLTTDLLSHDMGMGKGMDRDKAYDTPTLSEVWRTAPYLHDGRAATILDVLTVHNPGDRHGRTSHLTLEQLEDLVAYILSL